MCHSRFVLLLTLVTFGLSFEHFRLDGRAQEADDARLLQGMGLPADTGRLLHFLRMRTYKEADRIVLENLIKQLNGSYKERERASRELRRSEKPAGARDWDGPARGGTNEHPTLGCPGGATTLSRVHCPPEVSERRTNGRRTPCSP